MVVYTLEHCWKILRHYFENHRNVAECGRKLHRQLRMFVILWSTKLAKVRKYWKLASSSINQSVKSQKQRIHPRILLLWQKECVKRYKNQLTVVFNNWTFRRHHWEEFCIKTMIWCHTKMVQELKPIDQPMYFSYAKWACDRFTEDASFDKKKSSFQMKFFFILAGM